MRITKNLTGLLVLALLIAVGCDSDNSDDDDTEVSIAGQYEATTLEASGEDLPISADVLEFGGELSATLNADNTVQGRLFVPEALLDQIGEGEASGDAVVNFDGTYTSTGSMVRFDVEPTSDAEDFDASFIENVEWTFDDGAGTLSTEVDATDEILLTAVLTQQ